MKGKISCQIQNLPTTIVKADIMRTEQVITNYLDNALNHVDKNKVVQIGIHFLYWRTFLL